MSLGTVEQRTGGQLILTVVCVHPSGTQVSVGIITEIILENAAMLITPYLMFRMYKEPIFMAVVSCMSGATQAAGQVQL